MVTGGTFTRAITIPSNAAPGVHMVVGMARDGQGNVTVRAAPFTVTAPPPSPPPPAPPEPPAAVPVPEPEPEPPLVQATDVFGPSIREAALTAANGTRTASGAGDVSLFCGRYEEAGVTGTCGATATPAKRAAAARAMSLRPRAFRARPGVPVFVRFRLTRSQRRMLAAARRMRMTGKVIARDALGNATQATFRVVLRAPRTANPPRH